MSRVSGWVFVLLVLGTGVLLALLALTVPPFGLPFLHAGRALDRAVDQAAVPQPTPVLQTASVVVRALRGASELTTAVYTLETVVDESQERRIGAFPLGRTQLLYIAHGQVRAGVDLDQVHESDVSVDGPRVTVHLPAPRILDAKIDVNRSYTYDIRRSLFGPNSPDLQSRAERFALDKILRAACTDGVLLEANAHAEVTVTKLLQAANSAQVVVVTQPPSNDACAMPGTPVSATPAVTPAPAATATP